MWISPAEVPIRRWVEERERERAVMGDLYVSGVCLCICCNGLRVRTRMRRVG